MVRLLFVFSVFCFPSLVGVPEQLWIVCGTMGDVIDKQGVPQQTIKNEILTCQDIAIPSSRKLGIPDRWS